MRPIARKSVIRLSQKDARKVLVLLDNPPNPNRLLKKAVRALKQFVTFLEIPHVDSAETAVKIAIAAQAPKQD